MNAISHSWVGFVFLAALAVALVVKSLISPGARKDRLSYRKRPIMTLNETNFFDQLRSAFPEYYIFPQVSMGAIVDPDYPRADRYRFYRARNSVSQKRIDFVLCEPKGFSVICIVELDDRSHSAAKDRRRDSITNAAGYKTARFESSFRSYEAAKIKQKISAVLLLEASISQDRVVILR